MLQWGHLMSAGRQRLCLCSYESVICSQQQQNIILYWISSAIYHIWIPKTFNFDLKDQVNKNLNLTMSKINPEHKSWIFYYVTEGGTELFVDPNISWIQTRLEIWKSSKETAGKELQPVWTTEMFWWAKGAQICLRSSASLTVSFL